MPAYSFRCTYCGEPEEIVQSITSDPIFPPVCRYCGVPMKRDYRADSPRVTTNVVYPEHFNPAVGRYVTSERDFADALKAGAEESFRQTGIESNRVPMHPSEIVQAQAEAAKRVQAQRERDFAEATHQAAKAVYEAAHDAQAG